jgi:hypothetical protein
LQEYEGGGRQKDGFTGQPSPFFVILIWIVLFWLACPHSPVLFWLPYLGFHILAIMSVMDVLFVPSCSVWHVLAACPLLADLILHK